MNEQGVGRRHRRAPGGHRWPVAAAVVLALVAASAALAARSSDPASTAEAPTFAADPSGGSADGQPASIGNPAPLGANGPCVMVGRSIPHPTTATEQVFIYDPTGAGVAETGGSCDDGNRPVVLFSHGYGARSPGSYAALIQHLVSRGFVVIYPSYPSAGTFATWIPMQDAGFAAGLDADTRADRSRIGVVSHSNGAGMTPRLVQLADEHGWGRSALFVAPMAAFVAAQVGSGPVAMPRHARWLQIAFDNDLVLDNGINVEIFDALQLPSSQKRHLTVLSDPAHNRGAGHLTPSGATADDMDVYGVWRPIDALAGCALLGVDCAFAAGYSQVGTTAFPANIVTDQPVDSNLPVPNKLPQWECDAPFNPRPCPAAPWVTTLRSQAVAAGGTTPAQSFTTGDHHSTADQLTVTTESADPELVPAADVRVKSTGTPGQFEVTATGAPGRSGRTVVGVVVTDPEGHASRRTFDVAFGDAAVATGGYHPLPPARVLDTRVGQGAASGRVGNGSVLDLQVTGAAGVPTDGVSAVVLNVTAENPTATGFVSAFPTGDLRPLTSNLNTAAGETRPNLVVARVGPSGRVSLFNNSGTTHLIADIAGWIDDGRTATATGRSRYVPVSPTRVLDTRDGTGAPQAPLGGGGSLDVSLAAACPPGGTVTAVAVNVTVDRPTATGHVTAWPAGQTRPTVSNLNFVSGQTVPNLAIVAVGPGTAISLFNQSGSTDLIADLAGCFMAGDAGSAGRMAVGSPSRLLDTRYGTGAPAGTVTAGQPLTVQVTGSVGVPATGVSAVVLNLTGTEASQDTHLIVWPAGEPKPLASNVNLAAGQTAPNLVIVKLSSGGAVQVATNAGATHVVGDVAGWILA